MRDKKFLGLLIPRAGFYLWFIFILIATMAFYSVKAAIIAMIFFIPLLVYYYKSKYIRRREVIKYIENLSFNINSATKGTLLKFPMPLVMLEVKGEVVWYNQLFRKIFQDEEDIQSAMESVVKKLQVDKIENLEKNISGQIDVGDKTFEVLGNFVPSGNSKQNVLVLYFVDITELMNIRKKYEQEKTVSSIIVIDNYEDLISSIEESKRSQLQADILAAITSWAEKSHGILRRYERDKYIFIFEHKYIQSFKEDKFSILDSVKDIKIGNKIPVTLSIGIGKGGKDLNETFEFASAAIDIALGRGGDQVVLKSGEEINFFGGKSREVEKRTKVKARVIAHALRELIGQYSQVFIMGHVNCDLDALGAAMGMYRFVKQRGKDAYIVLNNVNPTIEPLLSRISVKEEYEELFLTKSEAIENLTNHTLIIVVDTHRPGYTECPELLQDTKNVVVIDHHRKGTDFIQDAVLNYHETYASSTCELVTEILQYVDTDVSLKPEEAEALYAGIVMDTKNFTFKTGVRTFEAAAFLRRQGVDTIGVKDLMQKDIETFINISDVIRGAEFIDDSIAISVCPPNLKNTPLIVAQSADQMLSLKGITAAFVLSESTDEVLISGRSLGEINVQVIMEKLGGGGHLTVAGAQVKGVTLDEAKKKLYDAIELYKEECGSEAK